MLLMASTLLSACGASPGGVVDDEANQTTPDRSSTYVGAKEGASTPCGWVPMPTGEDEYVPCPSRTVRSPISDPPAEEQEHELPQGFERPEPPGDPPPM